MRAVKVAVGRAPHVIEIENNYKAIQKEVGGCFESAYWIFNDCPAVYVNDDGKFGCAPNRAVYARAKDAGKIGWNDKVIQEGDLLDIIYGDFICCGFDPETEEEKDITGQQPAA